jgi:hypothetical protein
MFHPYERKYSMGAESHIGRGYWENGYESKC